MGCRRAPRSGSFFGRFRAVPSAAFANAIVVLYSLAALLGARRVFVLPCRTSDPSCEQPATGRPWQAGLFDIKEHFVAIGLALLPAYWVFWQQAGSNEPPTRTRTALTSILAFIVWWGFLIGHVMNNIMGFGL